MSQRRSSVDKDIAGAYIEQSMKIINEPPEAPVLIYPVSSSKDFRDNCGIRNRLDKLKDFKAPSEDELASRLSKLQNKEVPSSKERAPKALLDVDKLVQQMTQEVQLDSKTTKPEDEISARLAHLRGNASKTEIESSVIKEEDLSTPKCVPTTQDNLSDVGALIQATKKELEQDKFDKSLSGELETLDKLLPPGTLTPGSSSSDEYFSDSDGPTELPEADLDEETKRVINMYTKKEMSKKSKRKKGKKDPDDSGEESDDTDYSEKHSGTDSD